MFAAHHPRPVVFINASIESLEEHLLFGSLLASLVVLLFIRNLRSVLIASVAIPTSIIATFTLLKVMDFTLNNMTLLALTLAVGIVIDDAIVVLENIVRYIEEKRTSRGAAAIEATKEITLAVLATTLSLVIIFLPIAFMSGYARRYVNQFGWTMAFAILVSMLVSFTLTPMLSSRLLRRRRRQPRQPRRRRTGRSSPGSTARTARMLRWSLDHRTLVLAMAAVTFAADHSPERPGRPRLDPARRPGRADARPEPARGHVARRHLEAWPPSCGEASPPCPGSSS